MTDDLRFERNARDWLELGPVEAPFDVVQAALLEIDTTPQERDLRVSWRFKTIPTFARALVAAAVIIGLAAGGALFLQRSDQGLVGGPSASPSVPSPAPSASPPPSGGISDTALNATFVSERYGYTLAVNPGWTTRQATVTWTGPDNSTPVIDEFTVPGSTVFFNGASQPLGPGKSFAGWLDLFQSEFNAGQSCRGGPESEWPTREIGAGHGRGSRAARRQQRSPLTVAGRTCSRATAAAKLRTT